MTTLLEVILATFIAGLAMPMGATVAHFESIKTKWIKEHIQEHDWVPTILWTSSAKFVEILKKELKKYNPVYLTGDVPKNQRQKSIQYFQSGRTNLLIANTKVASTGYTLDRAEKMIFINREWSVIDNQQANARFIPTQEGAEKKARVIMDLMIENSMDFQVRIANKYKLNRIEIVNNFKDWLGIKGEQNE